MDISLRFFFFFFNDTATTEIYTLSLHDALPISEDEIVAPRIFVYPMFNQTPAPRNGDEGRTRVREFKAMGVDRSEEHTSELQSPCNLVCRLLLEKKKKTTHNKLPHKTHVTIPTL